MFPFEIKPVEDRLNRELMNDFKGERCGFVQVGPKKWCLPASYKMHAEKFYTYPLRPDDVWVMTYPRSGTTMCQELVWLINNNLDYDTAARVSLEKRFPFFEFTLLNTENLHEEISRMNNYDPVVVEKLAAWKKPVYEWDVPSPRHLKTHLPFSLLPPDLPDKCKTIYVARNPKDVAVSYYHHNRLLRVHDYKGNFKKYWKYFTEDLLVFSPYWEHIKEGWEQRNKKNVLFLFYEDLVKKTAVSIQQIAEFLGKNISKEDIDRACEHLKIDNFRKNVIVNESIPIGVVNEGEQGFFRKGNFSMFPHKIKPVEESLNKQLMQDFKGERYGFIQVGTKKWLFPASYAKHAENFYTYPLKEDDIWLITFPRSGTTLCQELIWLLNNNLDYNRAADISLERRFPFFEYTILHTERLHEEVSLMNDNDPLVNEKLAFWRNPVYEWDLPSPRHIKTHLPFSLLPPDLTKICKVIYVARNPKDVAVSYYHHNRLLRVHDYKGDFEKYWKYFSSDLVVDAPYWEHINEAWELRNESNVLFLFYEDLKMNMADGIMKVANFMGKTINKADVQKLAEHLEIENFRKKVPIRDNIIIKGVKNIGEQDFIRKGQVGSKEEFTPELNEQADEWIKKHLSSTSLRFPMPL